MHHMTQTIDHGQCLETRSGKNHKKQPTMGKYGQANTTEPTMWTLTLIAHKGERCRL
eukprot:m.126866 g.126866  ORF g.126866 m.126866 type:complete len:57 (-) comp13844_c0_seq9:1195-1365(-)